MVCVSLERDKRYKMLPVLRAIIVLDSSEREVSQMNPESKHKRTHQIFRPVYQLRKARIGPLRGRTA